jgi:NADP-dependent 3-hydroxy acid dehydrogenase YdfG
MQIKDKIIIVTGATEGIGLATSELLIKQGAKVVMAARNQTKLKEIESLYPGTLGVVCDMTKSADIQNLIQKTIEKFGRIDILINNAGQGLGGNIESVNIEEYRKALELNVIGPLEALQLVVPIMKKQNSGMILNISSMVTKGYYGGLGAYSSTKYALNSLMFTARKELSSFGIIICVFMPKLTDTGFGDSSLGEKFDIKGAGKSGANVDTPQDVAIKILEQIESEVAEVTM